MLYLAIDQHSKQITVCVRNEEGDTVLNRQISTRSEKIRAFFQQLTERDAEFMVLLEVCGFNDWLIAGQTVHGLRRVYIATQREREDRELTALRKTLGQPRTRTLNKIHRIIHRHNLMWAYPTKTFQTQTGRRWLEKLELPEVDRQEMDVLLQECNTWDERIAQVDEKIARRASQPEPGKVRSAAQILMTAPGVSHYSGLALASRIGPERRTVWRIGQHEAPWDFRAMSSLSSPV